MLYDGDASFVTRDSMVGGLCNIIRKAKTRRKTHNCSLQNKTHAAVS
jgi:hypothetical protein